MSKIEKKIWGATEPLIITPMFEMHRLTIRPNVRCSLHVHRFKWNAFYVIDGKLFIDSVAGELSPVFITELGRNEHTTVGPSVFHQFRTGDLPCTVLEMYYTEPLSEDIIRRNVGGPV